MLAAAVVMAVVEVGVVMEVMVVMVVMGVVLLPSLGAQRDELLLNVSRFASPQYTHPSSLHCTLRRAYTHAHTHTHTCEGQLG